MPPVAAAVGAVAPLVIPAAIGTMAYATVKGVSEAKKTKEQAKEEAEKQRKWQTQQLQTELEAGEYFAELNKEQMELQAQAANISTLANLIESRREQQASPVVFTLPEAKVEKYDPVNEINKAIDSILRGS